VDFEYLGGAKPRFRDARERQGGKGKTIRTEYKTPAGQVLSGHLIICFKAPDETFQIFLLPTWKV
jgi:hypothetical protein